MFRIRAFPHIKMNLLFYSLHPKKQTDFGFIVPVSHLSNIIAIKRKYCIYIAHFCNEASLLQDIWSLQSKYLQ